MNKRLTLDQAAQTLGVSERTLRRHIQAGKIRAIKNRAPGRRGGWLLEEATVRFLIAPNGADEVEEQEEAIEAERQETALMGERVEQLEREAAQLREQLAEALERIAGLEAREDERNVAPATARAWWPRSKSRE